MSEYPEPGEFYVFRPGDTLQMLRGALQAERPHHFPSLWLPPLDLEAIRMAPPLRITWLRPPKPPRPRRSRQIRGTRARHSRRVFERMGVIPRQ